MKVARPTIARSFGALAPLIDWTSQMAGFWRGRFDRLEDLLKTDGSMSAEGVTLQPTNVTTEELADEDQVDQRVRRRPGQGAALLHRCAGLHQEDRFQQWSVSLADRRLARRARRNRAAARAQRQSCGQGLSASAVPARPARSHVLHRRRQGRLRAHHGARRRIQDAADRGHRLDHRPGRTTPAATSFKSRSWCAGRGRPTSAAARRIRG